MLKKILFRLTQYSGLNYIYELFSYNKLFIIGYHSIFSNSNKDVLKISEYSNISISEEMFEKQIKFLVDHNHSFLSFKDLSMLKKTRIKKPTIIYFDDGFKDNILNVLPILKKYNLKATFFIVPAYVDSVNNRYMKWDDIRELNNEGMEIGSHTYNHVMLTKVPPNILNDELISSKLKIEKEIGIPIKVFSYPKGRLNDDVVKAVKDVGYEYAVTTKYGLNSFNWLDKNPYFLKKVAPRVYESFSDFIVRLYIYNIFR